jgi:mono/diheme cytochrome c family protein
MAFVSRRTLVAIAILALAALLAFAAAVWSGFYNVAADDPHTRPAYVLLETIRDRSIARRSDDLPVPPDLADPARIVQGAGNYDAMCAGCHLTPGSGPTELSQGLSPAPPDLTTRRVEPARAFWVVKHGVKATGMPAWGRNMADPYLWNVVAFLQRLPDLDAAGYRALVDASEGHSHGGTETEAHAHRLPSADGSQPAAAVPHDDGHDHGAVAPHDDGHDHGPPAPAAPAPAEEHDHADHEH